MSSRHYNIEYDRQGQEAEGDKRTPSLKRFKSDPYLSSLLQLVNQVEVIYGLDKQEERTDGESRQLADLDIQQLHDIVKEKVNRLDSKTKRQLNIKASGVMGSVLYLDYLLKFNQEYKIRFDDHPGIGTLVGLLSKFKNIETCKDYKRVYLNAVIKSLQMYERVSLMRINTKLSYKLLRIFYILVMYDNVADSSIVANMLLYQVRYSIQSKVSFDNEKLNVDEPIPNPSPTRSRTRTTTQSNPSPTGSRTTVRRRRTRPSNTNNNRNI